MSEPMREALEALVASMDGIIPDHVGALPLYRDFMTAENCGALMDARSRARAALATTPGQRAPNEPGLPSVLWVPEKRSPERLAVLVLRDARREIKRAHNRSKRSLGNPKSCLNRSLRAMRDLSLEVIANDPVRYEEPAKPRGCGGSEVVPCPCEWCSDHPCPECPDCRPSEPTE